MIGPPDLTKDHKNRGHLLASATDNDDGDDEDWYIHIN